MKVHFYLDRRKEKVQQLPIFMHFWYKGKLLRIFTGEHCNPGEWNLEKERILPGCKGASEINKLLQSMEEEVLLIVRSARTGRRLVDVGYIRDHLAFISGRGRDFFSVWEEFVTTQSAAKNWGQGMIKRFDILRMHLKVMEKQRKISFNNIDDTFYHRFIRYHRQHGFQENYAARNLELLRWFMNWATLNGYNLNMSYKRFKQSKVKPVIVEGRFLSADELMKLYKLNADNPFMDSVKDIFCFGCVTGLRYADMIKLDKQHISGDKLIYTREKPKMRVEIPLVVMATEILDKYRPYSNGKIFPDISLQVFNKALKDLGKLAGLNDQVKITCYNGSRYADQTFEKWQLLSSKFTRWTFLKLGVEMGMGLEVMSELTGNLPGTLKNYYTSGNSRKYSEMQKFNLLLNE